MRRIITRAQAVKYTVYLLLFLAVLTVFPLRMWHEKITSEGNAAQSGVIAIDEEAVSLQQFTADYDHIDSIGFYVNDIPASDTFCLRVFNDGFMMMREETLNTGDLGVAGSSGYIDVYLNLDTEVGKTYYYTLQSMDDELNVAIGSTAEIGLNNFGYMQYAGNDYPDESIITRYIYSQPLRKGPSAMWIIGLVLVGVLFTCLINALSRKKEDAENKLSVSLNKLCTPQWILKRVGNPVVVIAAVAALICIIPLHIFSIYIADLIVMSLGVLFLTGILLYLINRDYGTSEFDLIDYVKENWQNLLQSLFIALAIYSCVSYMNGLYEIHHDIAWRKMVFFLGVSLIVTFTRREFFNIYNILMIIISSVAARIYYVKNLPDMEDEFHVAAMKYTSLNFIVIGTMAVWLIRSIILAVKDRRTDLFKNISWPYTILTIALAVGMVVKRNTRYWPVMMVIAFGTIAIRFFFWENRRVFLMNVSNGILMHFIGAVAYALWHRPYEAFTYARYPFIFHTVTETACYMSLVVAIAMVRLFYKYNKTHKLKDCIWEMLLFGTVTAYLLFTMSRTGMVAVVAAGLVSWIGIVAGEGKGKKWLTSKLKYLLISAGTVVLSVIFCFPISFSLQKAVPGLVGEPRLMEIEQWSYEEDVLVSTNLQSEEFITFGRFVQVFLYKMAGLPENTTKLNEYTVYGKAEEYKTMVITDEDGNILYSEAPSESLLAAESAMADASKDSAAFKEAIALKKNSYSKKSDFEPPYDYYEVGGEGDVPDEWYNEDYWFYNSETGRWEFGYWMLEEEDDSSDVSNGRTDIYRCYIEQMTPEGHEGMGAILDDGSEAAHAHDIYLQVAYDHGIIVGVLFLIWVIATCIQALVVFMRRRGTDPAAGVMLTVSVTYAMAGIVEWISHPCNPLGCAMLLVIIPMALLGREKA